MKTSDFLSFAV